MKARAISMMLCVLVSASGCATIISGNQQTVPVTSTPPGATVRPGNGVVITTPGSITLTTKQEHTLVAEYPGCEPKQQTLVKKLNNWVFCDPLWDFGIISLPIDFISGAANELRPKAVHFNFAPRGTKPRTVTPLLGTPPNLKSDSPNAAQSMTAQEGPRLKYGRSIEIE